ncbi:hypothetical protein ABENE_04925 [Asticcacaulis benevestitus DSM 16100 = ATCC BAA-896]|uniref:Uncharacterized protein n=1 Tax=Asticcacaulis benevestitus DSM 16100 = ATCC BAA-896 TaxID=1121022 RepID=V4RR60_9CAUL|nr:hypothetical protein ABENE_04925 [Asticcacaulis benevestitus DSM 16100 = ATCC BAA-896]
MIAGLVCVAGLVVAGGFALSGRLPVDTPLAKLSPDAVEAKAFLTALYDHYTVDSDWSPMGVRAADWFAPSMVALMQEDARLNEGYTGAIEADPICDCQDYGKLTADIKVINLTQTSAQARVVLSDSGVTPPSTLALVYDLVKVKGGWRIHDITGSRGESLRHRLIKSNADMKAQDAQSSL